MLEEKRQQLLNIYRQWAEELQTHCSELIDEKYSYPYYLHIPDNWFDSQYRLLIVGEEGYGKKQYDLPIEEVQSFNKWYLEEQLGEDKKRHNRSAFWRRIRCISDLFDPDRCSITWTNLDKIHRSGTGNCRLTKRNRDLLHQTPTHILSEEIRLLNPTHVIYFGWYGISLLGELADEFESVFHDLYPNGLRDSSAWEPKKFKVISRDAIHHIFTYHPGWGQRQKGYEEEVLDTIAATCFDTACQPKE